MKQLALFSLLVLTACSSVPAEGAVQTALAETQAVWTVIPSQTAYPTYTAAVPVLVTATATETPIYTPTITPTFTATLRATEAALATQSAEVRASRGDGFYLVGEEIAPGVWRSTPGETSCYWSVTTKSGNILQNFFGNSGGTAYIPYELAYQVEFSGCGQWKFVEP